MSNMVFNGEPQPWLQDILDTYFPEQHLRSKYVQRIESHARIIDFPRSLYCDCDRCRSPFHELSVLSRTMTITMENSETYTADLPGDPDALTHVWKNGRKKTEEREIEDDDEDNEEWEEW